MMAPPPSIFEKLPWSQMKRSVIRPKADELKAEIIQPSPKTVVSSKGSEMARRESNWHWIWQGISPSAVDERLVIAEKAAKETEEESNLFNKRWIGKEPILQLIHALIDDDDRKRAYPDEVGCLVS